MEEVKEQSLNNSIELYGSFFVDSTEFAIHVDFLQEVVSLPEKLIKIPLAPPFLVGVFNLRGIVIPVVSLRVFLKFAPSESVVAPQIAIVEYGGVRVGLLFDSTGEILRVRAEEKSDFQYTSESSSKVIGGAIKLDGANRLLQVIDPHALVEIENIPHVLENQKKLTAALEARHGQRKKCISFVSAGMSMAFEIGGIHEILRVPEIKHSMMESRLCLGTISVRGQIIPVIDFAELIGKREKEVEAKDDRRIIILKIGNEFFGLMVDAVNNISSYYQADVMPIPLLSKERAEMFQGCIEFANAKEVILLNHLQILSDAEVVEITLGHSKIYQSESREHAAKKNLHRQVYISFRIDQLFAVPIGDVKEIIDLPKNLTKAPGMPSFVRGILNLRGQLVTVVDARILYAMPEEHCLDPKILIFQAGTERLGLLVDSVENILNIADEQKIALPDLLYSSTKKNFESDVKEAIQVTASNGEKYSLIVLNTAPLAERIRTGKAA
jgi:purine-binding chemotaxis protein CheW